MVTAGPLGPSVRCGKSSPNLSRSGLPAPAGLLVVDAAPGVAATGSLLSAAGEAAGGVCGLQATNDGTMIVVVNVAID